MVVQLTIPVHAPGEHTLADEVRSLSAGCIHQSAAPAHVEASAAITRARFADWGDRILTMAERKRVEAYFRGVLRRRIIAGKDADACEARRLLVARSIEQDLVDAGWDRARALHQACDATGIALSA